MAKFSPGPLAGAISGSIGGSTYSHNRYGPYIRRRAIPTTSTTADALAAKARLGTASADWQNLTNAQRAAWLSYAQTNPVTDTLGNPQVLTGHQLYISLNTRIARAGDTAISLPPVDPAPDSLVSLSLNLDIGAGAFDATYTSTPLGADDRLWLRACVLDSPGITFVENLLKLVSSTAKAQASPYDFQADIEARFGTLSVNQVVVVQASVFDSATGLLSKPLRAHGTVVTT